MSPRWGRKKPKPKVDGSWLDIVRLTSTQSLGPGTQFLEEGWIRSEWPQTGVGVLIAKRFSRHVLEFTPVNKRSFLESLGRVPDSAPTGDLIVLLGDINSQVGNDSQTLRGVIGGQPPSSEREWCFVAGFLWYLQLVHHKNIFEHRGVHCCTWLQDALGQSVSDTKEKRGVELFQLITNLC